MFDYAVNFLHLLATSIWIGGAIYIHLILLPSLRRIDPQQSGKLQGIVAKKFSLVAWTCIIVLLITGYLKTPDGMLFDTSSEFGMILMIKHVFIAGVIVVGLIIALYVVPNMSKAAPKPGEQPSPEFFKHRKRLQFLAMVNLIFGVLILVYASMLW